MVDAQRSKRISAIALQQGDDEVEAKLGVLGVLSFCPDSTNLFLFLLRLGGHRP